MKKLLVILLSLAMVFSMAGCKNSEENNETKKVKIAVIVPQKRGDLGFTDSIYQGVEDVKNAYGDKVEISFTECAGDSSKFESREDLANRALKEKREDKVDRLKKRLNYAILIVIVLLTL